MNKHLTVFLFSIQLTVMVGCSRYNYQNIFPFEQEIFDRSFQSLIFRGYECNIKKGEIDKITLSLTKSYGRWNPLKPGDGFHSNGVFIDARFYSTMDTNTVFTTAQDFDVDGMVPTIIYFPYSGKMLFFLAEDGVR